MMTPNERELLIAFAEWLASDSGPGGVILRSVDEKNNLYRLVGNDFESLVDEFNHFQSSRLWGVYKNTDMTEGRGMQYLARLFRTKSAAEAWVATQADYPGHPMHKIQPVSLDPSKLDDPEGLAVPR